MSDEPRLVRYRPDKINDFKPHSDGTGSFSSFLLSEQIQKPLMSAGRNVVAVAAHGPHEFNDGGDYVKHFDVEHAVIQFKAKGQKRHPRAIALVTNDSDHAAAIEFGSGRTNEGQSPGKPRPQGGGNVPYRILGRAAGKIGDWHE